MKSNCINISGDWPVSTDIDIAIIGGGNAGLTLAAELAAQPNPPSTVVFEPRSPNQRDCSWGLWALHSEAQKFNHSIRGRWRRWQLIDDQGPVVHSSNNYSYISLSSADYLLNCSGQLHQPVSQVSQSVTALKPEGDHTLVETDGESYRAKTVYDSRPPKLAENGLRQHFLGLHIQTRQPIADPGIATLMDFRVDQSRGLHFIYALPYSDHHLLIESTLISTSLEPREWYRNSIDKWLEENHIQVAEIVSEEIGVIPMDTLVGNSFQPLAGQPRIAPIGLASGAARRSSGYAFHHIQQQISQLAAGIARGDMAVPQPISNKLTFMDKIFNGVLLERPELAVSLYMETARALNSDEFARFMLGEASTKEWLRVITAMPQWPFIKQLIRQLLHD